MATKQKISINELIRIADKAYNHDGIIAECWDFTKERPIPHPQSLLTGDGLSYFIVCELFETYNQTDSREAQIDEAVRVLSSASEQLNRVIDAITRA